MKPADVYQQSVIERLAAISPANTRGIVTLTQIIIGQIGPWRSGIDHTTRDTRDRLAVRGSGSMMHACHVQMT